MLSLEGCWNVLPHARRRGWHAAAVLMTLSLAACDSGVAPPQPGSMVVTTETSGFLKASGYELMVDGVNNGAIGANDEITIAELDPGDYQVELSSVPANCSVEAATVTVEPQMAATVSLPVACTFDTPTSYSIQFSRERPNLDTGDVITCPFGICSSTEEWDLYVYNSLTSDPHSIIRQNENTAVEIAHLPGVTLQTLAETDLQGATFTTDQVGDPFDAGRVILMRTDRGNVYALGNPLEDTTNGRLSFDAALIATQ
jgi:hypothetical protein